LGVGGGQFPSFNFAYSKATTSGWTTTSNVAVTNTTTVSMDIGRYSSGWIDGVPQARQEEAEIYASYPVGVYDDPVGVDSESQKDWWHATVYATAPATQPVAGQTNQYEPVIIPHPHSRYLTAAEEERECNGTVRGSAPAAGNVYRINESQSHWAMDVPAGAGTEGLQMIYYPESTREGRANNQEWRITRIGTFKGKPTYRIKSEASKKCLAAGSDTPAAAIVQRTCPTTTPAEQLFQFVPVGMASYGPPLFKIVSVKWPGWYIGGSYVASASGDCTSRSSSLQLWTDATDTTNCGKWNFRWMRSADGTSTL
jgi:hypothetical protein